MDKGLKRVLIVGGLVSVALIAVAIVMGSTSGWHGTGSGMMDGNGIMGGFGMLGIMSIFWIAVLGFIIWAVVAATRGTGRSVLVNSVDRDSALEILKMKYACGEIDKAEFEDKRKDLA